MQADYRRIFWFVIASALVLAMPVLALVCSQQAHAQDPIAADMVFAEPDPPGDWYEMETRSGDLDPNRWYFSVRVHGCKRFSDHETCGEWSDWSTPIVVRPVPEPAEWIGLASCLLGLALLASTRSGRARRRDSPA